MKITGESLRSGSEFRFVTKPTVMAPANFVAIKENEIIVTRRPSELFNLPDHVWVIANWHGERRTDAFLLTVGDLKAKAKDFVR
jgi:hypothetical protein